MIASTKGQNGIAFANQSIDGLTSTVKFHSPGSVADAPIRNQQSKIESAPVSLSLRFPVKVIFFIFAIASLTISSSTLAQRRRPTRHAAVCGNPQVACKTSATFKAYDLPFRVGENSVIVDTVPFYAVILKSVGKSEEDCDAFVPEPERLAAQEMFPDHKVFSSRCADVEELFYENMSPKRRFMGVYAGATLADANRLLKDVQKAGKFPGAYIKRTRTGFNGT